MTLRKKSILFIGLITAASMLVCYVLLYAILYSRFSELESQEMQAKMEHVFFLLDDEMERIEKLMLNYSAWDDTIAFIQRAPSAANIHEDPYIVSNYPNATFSENMLSAIALLDREGTVLYGRSYHPASDSQLDLEQIIIDEWLSHHNQLLHFSGPEDSYKGITQSPEGPLMTVSLPIVNSEVSGPMHGTLIAGSIITPEMEEQLSKRARLTVRISKLDENFQIPESDMTVAQQTRDDLHHYPVWVDKQDSQLALVQSVYPDMYGHPSYLVTIHVQRDILTRGMNTIIQISVAIFVIIALLFAGLLMFNDRFIHRRIQRLATDIDSISSRQDFSLRVQSSGHDEFSKLELAFNDMLFSLEEAYHELQEQVRHDTLTRLPNRASFFERMESLLKDARTAGTPLAVLFIDLDNFKWVNDTWGHETGDTLLMEVGSRIIKQLAPGDVVSRLGGDEFTVLLTGLGSRESAYQKAKVIHDALASDYHFRGLQLHITASIGVSLFPEDGTSPEALVQYADMAMHQAKHTDKQQAMTFSEDRKARIDRQLLLEKDLHTGIANMQFELHFQPILAAGSLKVIRLESLLRWKHPVLGSIPPAEFIPLAESSQAIVEIGYWVLFQACKAAKDLHNQGFTVQVAVNVSVIQLEQDQFAEDVIQILHKTGLPPEQLELEMTESAVMSFGRAPDAVQKLTEYGVAIALDDFGTGYSSLSYLRKLPIQSIKIDKAFVTELTESTSDKTICAAITQLGHHLGLRVVAEGVENIEQVAILRRLGCDELQGYYFSKPLSWPDLLAYLNIRREEE
ncbi:EAL domain-containing protein [Paenibacillus tarimensis]|uniref:EAL domain-containing protein n=1 Tax=Paenibacillus tarimensis TaxID=416012 RepID=UPI001F26C2A7|nr:EAL domain-containing protein [Paenibacillus tarimensis]MCF2944256.1 EAL domain-containing protein [Paenibacillus tarimensis]